MESVVKSETVNVPAVATVTDLEDAVALFGVTTLLPSTDLTVQSALLAIFKLKSPATRLEAKSAVTTKSYSFPAGIV